MGRQPAELSSTVLQLRHVAVMCNQIIWGSDMASTDMPCKEARTFAAGLACTRLSSSWGPTANLGIVCAIPGTGATLEGVYTRLSNRQAMAFAAWRIGRTVTSTQLGVIDHRPTGMSANERASLGPRSRTRNGFNRGRTCAPEDVASAQWIWSVRFGRSSLYHST